jgi:hypothetical protein
MCQARSCTDGDDASQERGRSLLARVGRKSSGKQARVTRSGRDCEREPSPYLASGRGRIASKIASRCFHESVGTAFWGSFLFLRIENGFTKAVGDALNTVFLPSNSINFPTHVN